MDNLTYKQIYNKLESLNKTCYDFIYQSDFESFQKEINTFIESGISQLPNFEIAKQYYKFNKKSTTINGIWGEQEFEGLMDRYTQNNEISNTLGFIRELNYSDIYIKLIDLNDFIQKYGYDEYESEVYEGNKTTTKNNRDKRRDAIVQYINLYKDLYSDNSIFYNRILDVTTHQKNYIYKIKKLADLRSQFYLTYNFLLFDESFKINNTLKKLSLKEKVDLLNKSFDNLYKNHTINASNIRNYLKFEDDDNHCILFTNYLQGKYMDRKNWKNYCKGILPKNPLFYIELAFYLCIPSSKEVEKFLNLHGFSLNSDFLFLQEIVVNNKIYNIMYADLKKWIDVGVDYDLINEILGFELEIKEVRKK